MAVGSSISRSRRGRGSERVRRPRPKPQERHPPAKDDDGEVKEPDTEDLRRRRTAYYARPVAERQRIIRPMLSTPVMVRHRSRPTASRDRSKKKRSSNNDTRKAAPPLEDAERAAEYVYGSPSGSRPSKDRARTHDHVDDDDHPTLRRRHSARSSSSRRSFADLDSEVTPDDSISVVAERRLSNSSSHSSRHRPSIRRSKSTSARLLPIDETRAVSAVEKPRRAHKRDSTLLGSFLGHQSTTSVATPARMVDCLTCGEVPHSKTAKLACGHRMCHDCLKRVFEMSITDPAHMPPRCCTEEHIPLKHVDKLFDTKFKLRWNRKYQEYNTKNRIYCVTPKCGEWIKPSHIHRDSQGRKYAQCPRCKMKVCTLCNNKMHRSRDCPKDPEIARLVEQAKEKGWQRCYECAAMVELKEGCNHMTCRCKAEFCMICGAKWKTCDCPWFNYTNLPNPDRLQDMRVPEPIQVMYRRVFDAAQPQPRPVPAENRAPGNERLTYQQEQEQRRRQERLDEDLARRMQLASIFDPEDDTPEERRAHMETWGLGNAAGHFMNDDFVQNAANVVMNAFGDAEFGLRGERSSNRRRRARQSAPAGTGLVPDFLGDESILGVGAARTGQRAAS